MTADDRECRMELLNDLGNPDWRIRRKAVGALLRTAGEGSLPEFIRKLRQEHRDPAVLNSVLQILVSMGSESLPILVELTRDADNEVRMYSALALGDLNDPSATSALRALLDDPDLNVRYHAIESLAKLNAADAVDDLAAIAESGEFFLGFAAIDAIAAIGEPRVALRLISLLENDVLQTAVVSALAELGDENIVPSLITLMDRSNAVGPIALALVRLHERYETLFGEGQHVADLVRGHASAGAA